MILEFKYFGMIAERLNCEAETVDLNVSNLGDLENIYAEKLAGINFKIAVNKQLVAPKFKLTDNDEVAFLPPFAGG